MATFSINNERNQPLVGVTVEFVSPTGRILTRGTTDGTGRVTFAGYTERDGYPRPQITRHSGKSGEMTNTGRVSVQPVADPLPTSFAFRDDVANKRFPADQQVAAQAGTEKGVLKWDVDGILKFFNGSGWQELSPELPTADPGNGELWLECPP
jgi:hypothetical protein